MRQETDSRQTNLRQTDLRAAIPEFRGSNAPAAFTENLRGFVARLKEAGELVELDQPVDTRHMATLVDQSDKALLFNNPVGYEIPVLSGIIRSRNRAFLAMGCSSYREVETMLTRGLTNPIPPIHV